eukprot:scaffold319875_cov17-Tisochrysis_lutea.AAC.1
MAWPLTGQSCCSDGAAVARICIAYRVPRLSVLLPHPAGQGRRKGGAAKALEPGKRRRACRGVCYAARSAE